MSKGQERVRLSFNVQGDPGIEEVKARTAELIDLVEPLVNSMNPEIARAAKVAQYKYEEACMWAVKAMTG